MRSNISARKASNERKGQKWYWSKNLCRVRLYREFKKERGVSFILTGKCGNKDPTPENTTNFGSYCKEIILRIFMKFCTDTVNIPEKICFTSSKHTVPFDY